MFARLRNNKRLPETLQRLCFGWNHGLIEINGEVKHGAFVYIYHLYPGGSYSVEPLWAFPDKTIYLQLQWGEICSTLKRLKELTMDKTIVGFPPENAQVIDICRFVFKVVEVDSRVDSNDLMLEIIDVWKQLGDEPDALDLCRSAVRRFCEEPTDVNLNNLKETYFSIPHQRRSFLISMDAKGGSIKSCGNRKITKIAYPCFYSQKHHRP